MDSTGTLWLPPGHSTFASDVDFLFYVIAYLSLAFFVIVTVGSLYLAFRYRNKGKGSSPQASLTMSRSK